MAWLAAGGAVSGDQPGIAGLWRDAVVAALADAPGLAGRLNRIGDDTGEAAPVPFAQVGEIIARPWGGAGRPGRELLFSVSLFDRGSGDRLDALVVAAEAALLVMPREVGGWDVGGVTLVRVRQGKARGGLRSVVIEAQVRMLAGG